MENIKNLIACMLSALAAYFHPISDIVFCTVYIFGLNFVLGLIAGMAVDNESFSFKKAFMCIIHTCVFFLIIASVYFVGEHMGNQDGAIQCVTAVTYALIYFLAVNILKNLKALFVDNRWISFVYYCISMEFVKKIPFMSEFLKQESQKETEE